MSLKRDEEITKKSLAKVCEQCGNPHRKKYSDYCSDKCQVDNLRARAFGRNTLNDTIRNLKQKTRQQHEKLKIAIDALETIAFENEFNISGGRIKIARDALKKLQGDES